jgi:hypothetical protein
MVWQAADGMRFRLAGGYIKIPGHGEGVIGTGPKESATWTMDALTTAHGARARQFTLTTRQVRNLRAALRSWDVSYIVVTDTGAAPVEAAAVFTTVTGTVPAVSHRAWTWHLSRASKSSPDNAATASTAAAAFMSCRSTTANGTANALGTIPSGHPLPQSLNRCIAAGDTP